MRLSAAAGVVFGLLFGGRPDGGLTLAAAGVALAVGSLAIAASVSAIRAAMRRNHRPAVAG